MQITLRPHHFLCLQGYKGLNYSAKQANSWTKVSDILKNNPECDILIVNGKDSLCEKCPATITKNKSHCLEPAVNILDKKIRKLLGIKNGQIYKYNNITEKMNKVITKNIHQSLCSTCAWWKKGLCRDSFNT